MPAKIAGLAVIEKRFLTETVEYPRYENLDISRYPLLHGFYSLGFCQIHRPDCLWLYYLSWASDTNYDWLETVIAANQGQKKICLIINDESLIHGRYATLASFLDQHHQEPIYVLTKVAKDNHSIYIDRHRYPPKILEFPYTLLNDVLTYYAVKKTLPRSKMPQATKHQYICMISNCFSSHKTNLVDALISKKLSGHGMITVKDLSLHPQHWREFVVQNPHPPYQNTPMSWGKIAAQIEVNGIWISGNVENFLHIEQTYDMPLVIHPETSPGIFFPTEKSIWPALLGKMYLIYGGPGCMAWIQQFHDVTQTRFADVNFDGIVGDYTEQDYLDRLDAMLDHNRYLITNAREIGAALQNELSMSSWNIGGKMYDFFINQLRMIDS